MSTMNSQKFNIVFFGTSEFSVVILERLMSEYDVLPTHIVTTPDQPSGRNLTLTASPVKKWALEKNIPFIQPEKLDNECEENLKTYRADVFLVASYGKIIPKDILTVAKHGSLNIHPSLLPLYRGPSPIQSQILNNEEFLGTTIMLMDEKMDHGPIITQEEVEFERKEGELIDTYQSIEKKLAEVSADLFFSILSEWAAGTIVPQEQDHNLATLTSFIKKNDGLIKETDDDTEKYRKYLAFDPWPGIHFFLEKNAKPVRLLVKKASFKDGTFTIEKVLPEGKKEMSYEDFLKGFRVI